MPLRDLITGKEEKPIPPGARKTIIPIAGGKGGAGKTFLAANLGLALAERGKSVIVMDLHLGGSTLHSFLGLSNQFPGLGGFIRL